MNTHFFYSVLFTLSFTPYIEAVRNNRARTTELPVIVHDQGVKKKRQKKEFYIVDPETRALTQHEKRVCSIFIDTIKSVRKKSKRDLKYSKRAEKYLKRQMISCEKEERLEKLISHAESLSRKYLK